MRDALWMAVFFAVLVVIMMAWKILEIVTWPLFTYSFGSLTSLTVIVIAIWLGIKAASRVAR